MKAALTVVVALLLLTSANPQETGSSGKPQANSSTKHPLRVRVSRTVAASLMIKKVAPEYPPEAIKQRIQGDVVLKVLIDIQGIVTEVSYVSGNPVLKEAAIAAAKKYRFHSYLVKGEPVEMDTELVIRFRLVPESGSR